MHHRSSILVELRKWECVPMCASTDRQRAKEEKIVAVFLFLFFSFENFFRCVEKKKSEDKQWMRTPISIANMCQPGADYVCDWKPLDNALHASSFSHLVFYIIYIYVKTRRRACSNYGKMNAMRFVGWDVLLTWFGIYTFFFLSLSFLSNANRVSFHLSFFSLLTGDSISLSSSFQLSKWTNQSPLTSLFFSSLAFTESFVFSRLGRFFFFCFFLYSTLLCTNPSFRVFFLRCLFFSRCHPPRNKKKLGRARKRGGWTPQANPWIEKQKSNTHTHTYTKKKKRRRKNREKENSFFFHLYVRWCSMLVIGEQMR